jgi:sialic acid synthase SpsE
VQTPSPEIRIGSLRIAAEEPVLIVAEIGTGHGGSLERAKRLVDAAADAGADCAKFQLVYAHEIVHPNTGLVELPGGAIPLYERFRQAEQPPEFYGRLKELTEDAGLLFLCTPFGLRSAAELEALGVTAYKIASPELNHLPLLDAVARTGKPVFASSGVSRLADVERALHVLGDATVLLHCITAYPAPPEEYNLRVLPLLSGLFGVLTGVSDHSQDPVLVPALATALGARVVEKHITLANTDPGLDDPIAVTPAGLRSMVHAVRRAEKMSEQDAAEWLAAEHGAQTVEAVLGTGLKRLAAAEQRNYGRTNRSVHAVHELQVGTVLTAENTALLRTEQNLRPGLEPELYPHILGKTLTKTVSAGQGIGLQDLLAD